MSTKPTAVSGQLWEYLLVHSTPPDEIQRDLIAETRDLLPGVAGMQTAPDQAMLLTLLTRILGTRFAVEVGTFTGHSSLAIARGLTPGGRLLCCDISAEFTAVAQRYWKRAGVADRIDLRLAPALDTLRALPREPLIDFSFIDADKQGYIDYWDEIVPRTRAGGLILVDNVFAAGGVVAEREHGPMATAIRAFNDHAAADQRVDLVMLSVADGLTVACRR